MPKRIFKHFQPKLTCLDMNLFVAKIFFITCLLVRIFQAQLHIVLISYVIVGFLPSVDVDAHRVQVSVRGGDGDGQLSPRDERW